ncbi:hypothetical protein DdX_17191 [Ditylenchus destructor]|uniref:Uncharacterized protein n=1 Tax=Ditylenchus destructor TaxID=166010 RepID=A0AAD4QW09_9BILA|nr:hypothetical protein DdX_17191 [Ditylenchus destructor]
MNLILYAVAASILVNAANSASNEKSVEEETKEMKTNLERLKVKLESMKENVADHHRLENNFKTAATNIGQAIETLSDSLKVFRWQRIDKEKIEDKKKEAEAGKTVELKTEEIIAETSMPKENLKWVQTKLRQVITTIDAMRSGAKSYHSIVSHTTFALRYAGELSKALDVALEVKKNAIHTTKLRYFAGELYRSIQNIKIYTESAKQTEKTKELAKMESTGKSKSFTKNVAEQPQLELSIFSSE